jgi:hypothetical protein
MRSVVAVAPSRVAARTVLVPELLPADAEGAEPSAMLLRSPYRGARARTALAGDYAGAPLGRRGDLLDVYC